MARPRPRRSGWAGAQPPVARPWYMEPVRLAHRLLGLLLILPLLAWAGTGLLFHLKPGWTGAYEVLQAFDQRPVELEAVLPPHELLPIVEETTGWELGSTALGPVYRIHRGEKGPPLLLHATTGALLSPLGSDAVAALAKDAAARAAAKSRYGEIESVELTERQGVVRFRGGATVRIDRRDLGINQRGPDTEWIDRLYEIHYLRWTGVQWLDRLLSPLAILGICLLAFSGARLLLWSVRIRRPARRRPPTSSGKRPRRIRRGDLYWVGPEHGGGSRPHPHVVVQEDVFNRSRIPSVILCALTSNLGRANEPGNVLLDEGEGRLPKQSVVVVSQLIVVEKGVLGSRIGFLSDARVEEILAGLRFQQRSYLERSSG